MTEQEKSSANAIAQSNVLVVGEGAALAVNTVYQASAHANALALHNCVSAQNNLNILYPAIVVEATKLIVNA